jgi:hypothetical protein
MSRAIALSGLPEDTDATLDVAEIVGGEARTAHRLSRRIARRLHYLWQGLPLPVGDEADGGGEDGDANGGNTVTDTDPGNPPEHIAADFIGPDGGKVPDLSRIYVTVSRKGGPAPCGVTFQLRSADPNFWAFAMFGTAEWTFSTNPDEDYPFRHLDGFCAGERAGTAQGIYVAHTYERPGNHAWSVTLRYPGLAPRTIANAAVLLTRADLPPYLRTAGVDVPNWLGMAKAARAYTMTGVATGGRINVTMTNGHGTRTLRNIVLADGATAADVAAAIATAADKGTPGTQVEAASAVGVSFTASSATLNVQSSCPMGPTTVAIEPGDAAGVTWDGAPPDFSAPAPAGASQTLYAIPGVVTGGAITLAFANLKGTVDLGAIYLPSGATPWDVCHAIVTRMEEFTGPLKTIGVTTGVRALRIVYRTDSGVRLWITTTAALTPTTITLGVPSTPAGVTWAGGTAPDMTATVPAATGGSASGIVVSDPDTFFAARTVYASTAYPDGLALKAAAATLGIPADLADDRYYGGPEAYYDAAAARSGQGTSGNPWRILLHAGQRYVIAQRDREPRTVNLYVGRFGTGANPIVTIADTWSGAALLNYQDSNQKGWATFVDIDFLGLYDSANPPYSAGWMGHLFQCNSQKNYGLTLHRCIMSGWRTIISVTSGGMMAPVVSDSLMTSWYDFGMYANAIHAGGFAGVAIKQKLGTINVGRKSTATADVGDRYMHPPAAKFTNLFSWALEPAGGPPKKKAETVIPPGYDAPATGGWMEHPGGTAAWAWWVANWAKFTWKGPNADAFKNMDNDLYRACAVHGPVRGSTPSYQTGWHQCEFRSLNGWSRSGLYNQALPSDQQLEKAFAVQPCFRMNTAMGSNGPSPGHGTSMTRCGFEGGGTAVVAVPEQTFQPTIDSYSLGVGMVLDGLIYRALGGSKAAFSAQYGRTVLRNSVALFDGVAEDPQNLVVFGGADSVEPPGSAHNYSYNNTFIFARDLMAVNPNSKYGLARTNNRAPNKRMVVEWNNLVLRYAPIRNSGDYPSAGSFEPLADVLGLGRGHVPLAGSPALGAASEPVPHHDAAGAVRPAAGAVGAQEAGG